MTQCQFKPQIETGVVMVSQLHPMDCNIDQHIDIQCLVFESRWFLFWSFCVLITRRFLVTWFMLPVTVSRTHCGSSLSRRSVLCMHTAPGYVL
jgi:hypothetical protein